MSRQVESAPRDTVLKAPEEVTVFKPGYSSHEVHKDKETPIASAVEKFLESVNAQGAEIIGMLPLTDYFVAETSQPGYLVQNGSLIEGKLKTQGVLFIVNNPQESK